LYVEFKDAKKKQEDFHLSRTFDISYLTNPRRLTGDCAFKLMFASCVDRLHPRRGAPQRLHV
jgi:hypothetical protein